jgi:hypothetical protein
MPEIGAPKLFKNPALVGLRSWPVKSFEDILIFYIVQPDALRVVRVLHGKRDTSGKSSDGRRTMKPVSENALVRANGAMNIPAIIERPGGNARFAYDEFFKPTNNEHTRRAYARIVGQLLAWCEKNNLDPAPCIFSATNRAAA